MLISVDELNRRAQGLYELLAECRLCPRECKTERTDSRRGKCGAGEPLEISSYGPHFGEEPPLVGQGGSGTIFLANCSLRCVFCQNYTTSRGKDGYAITTEELAGIMLRLQQRGCVNINLVTPTHYLPQILESLCLARKEGMMLPLVYNCSGYERMEILRQLDGIVDIYLPDIKYADPETARKYSGVEDYPRYAKAALKEMHRQVGDLSLDHDGVATRGLLIRHLVMPGNLAGTAELMEFIAKEVSPASWINIMDQYRPVYHAHRFPEINRRATAEEVRAAFVAARKASPGFHLL